MGRFVTAQQVRDWSGDPDLPDARLNLLIPAAEDAVEEYCSREFTPATNVTREFSYEGGGYLDISPFELRSVAEITWNLRGDEFEAVDADNFALRGLTRQGTWLWMALARIHLYGSPRFAPRPSNLGWTTVRIRGDWGCASVPAAVVAATLIVVANQLENPSSAASRQVGGVGFEEQDSIRSAHIPEDAKGWLEPLARDSGVGVG